MAYTWEGMKRITREEAIERFNNNQEVYLLHECDDTESLVEELADIERHNEYGGEYGYELR